jgi:hypothetical protein
MARITKATKPLAFFFPVAGLFVATSIRNTVQAKHKHIPNQHNGNHARDG